MANEIDIIKLRDTTNLIFDHLIDDLKIEAISIGEDGDFYWEVPSDNLFKVDAEQPGLDIGRLTDDVSFLAALSGNKERAVALMFIHVAPLLRFVGEKVGK